MKVELHRQKKSSAVAGVLGLLVALALTGSLAVPAMAQYARPHAFYGHVYIGGIAAPEDTTIAAQIKEEDGSYVTCALAEVDDSGLGKYGYDTAFFVEGLTEGETIYFRVAGTLTAQTVSYMPGGVNRGSGPLDLYVAGTSEVPSVTTSDASEVGSTTTTLNGSLDDLGGASTVNVYFKYGTTISYEHSTSTQPKTSTGSFSADISGLTEGTEYHFAAAADDGDTEVVRADKIFTTIAAPLAVSTSTATGVTTASATLNGDLTSLGGASTVYVYFKYGKTASYGTTTDLEPMSSTGSFSATITGLDEDQQYHFRAFALGNTTESGSDKDFTTETSNGGGTEGSHVFYGKVYINGELQGNGVEVTAYVDGKSAESATTSSGWYGLNPTFLVSGQSGATVSFYVNDSLAPQTATWSLGGITRKNLYVTISGPNIAVSSSSFSFIALEEGGDNPPNQTLDIWNSGIDTITWSVADNVDWLSLSPTSGSSTGEHNSVTLSVDITGLATGSYSATITITAPEASNSPQTVSVSLSVGEPIDEPWISFTPSSFSFSAPAAGGDNPADKTLDIWNGGTGTINWSVSDGAAWLSLSPTSGSSTGEHDSVTLSVDITGLTDGSYPATITITASGAGNTPQTVSVTLTVGGGGSKLIGADEGAANSGIYYGDTFRLFRFQAEQTGTINTFKVKAWVKWENGNIKVAIYGDSSGEPGNLLGTGESPVTAGVWNDITITPGVGVVAGHYYWLAFNSSARIVYYTSSSCVDGRYKYSPYGDFSFPDPAGEGFNSSARNCPLIAGYE